jgi:NADPH2:quinone reductase
MAGLTVIATASRPETQEWVRSMGADLVIDHRRPLPEQLAAAGFPNVSFIANFSNTDFYWKTMAEVIEPCGRIVSIVENEHPLDMGLLINKSASFSWEFMFTRSMFQTPDMQVQHEILEWIARLMDSGKLRTTHTQTFRPINAENVRKVHALLESGKGIGKTVLEGWAE